MTFRAERFHWGDDAELVWHPREEKDWDESKHPRVPAGSAGGGQFGEGGGGARDAEDVSEFDTGEKVLYHSDSRPGVQMYSGLGNSFTINAALRDNDTSELAPELKQTIKDLDSEIDHSKTTADRVITRGLHGWSAIEHFVEPGTVVKDNGFMSASRNEAWAKKTFGSARHGFEGALINISVPKGSKMLTVAGSEEDEVILPRGTALKIKDAKVTGHDARGSRNWSINADVVNA
jgi:hypothetical protein